MKLPLVAALGAALCLTTTSCQHTKKNANTGGSMSSTMETGAKIQTAALELERNP